MPYDPRLVFDASPIYNGLASVGKAAENRASRDLTRRGQDLNYGIREEELAQGYYNIGERSTAQDKDLAAKAAIENARLGENADDRRARTAIEVARMDPRRFQLVPAPEVAGAYINTGTGQVVQTKPKKPAAAAKPEVSESGGVKFYRSRPEDDWKPVPAANPLNALLSGGGQGGGGQGAPVQTPAPGGLPVIKTKAERDALPKKARYIGADGKTYTKE